MLPAPRSLLRLRSTLAAILLSAAGMWAGSCGPAPPPAAPSPSPTPPPGTPEEAVFQRADLGVERALAPGATHIYRLELTPGHLLHVEIEQRSCDAWAQLLDGAGRVLIEVDSHTGDQGSEHLYHVVAAAGPSALSYTLPHTLIVRAFPHNPAPGTYVARIAEERPASARDRRYVEGERAFARAYALAEAAPPGAPPAAAVAGYEQAAAIWGRLGEGRRQADALYELGKLHQLAGRHRAAIACLERSLPLLAAPEDRRDRAIALNEMARSWRDLGEPRRARWGFERALALFREIGDAYNEASTLNNLGRLDGRRGRPLEALERLERAAGLWRRQGERLQLVGTLNLIGEVYETLGEAELALDHHRQALELLDARSEPLERATTLSFLGQALLRAGDLDGAAAAYGETLALRREGGDEVGRARAHVGLGLVEENRGDPRQALELYQQALATFQRREVLLDEAVVRSNLARLYLRLGEAVQAEGLYIRALEIFRRLGNHEGEATSLLGLARARRQLGRAAEALDDAEAALARIEEVLESGQAPAAREDLRLPYLASRQGYFDLYIELLMAEHRRRPGAGYDALALATSEQARARQLLEILAEEPAAAARGGADSTLLARQRALMEEINAADRELRRGLAEGEAETALAAARREQRRRLAEHHRLAEQVRRSRPWQASLRQPRPLALEEIRRLLDGDTLLLEFHLGEHHSYLWAVSRDRLESHSLPPGAEIEERARRAYALLVESDRITHRVPAERALEELAEVLLAPVVERLAGQRLVIVAGGALEYIPFAALPLPRRLRPSGEPRRRLVEEHEIVHLPSASVLAVLRRERSARPPAEGLLAVLADPVFGPEDERLGGRAAAAAATLAPGLPDLRRLPHSRREAEVILRLAGNVPGGGAVLAALGFEANRELATGGRLAGYRLLHFATHGVLHAEHPELSALVLSRYGADGRPRRGRLTLHEIYGLRLPAELVVLSACRTALGKEVRGEGLMGLPRGFLYAGAARVLVSLWSVQDEATAELMERFYHHLLIGGRSPAAALRAAQISMLAEPRYAPYHWAGFILQGDWL